MKRIVSVILLVFALDCVASETHELPDDWKSLVEDGLSYYTGGMCEDGDLDLWITPNDRDDWDNYRELICDPDRHQEAVEFFRDAWQLGGCLPLPIPADSLGADFEEYLCWP